MTAAGVEVEQPRDGVAIVRISNPRRLNALTGDMAVCLTSEIEMLATDSAVAAVVLTGALGAFSSGADLDMLRTGIDADVMAGAFRVLSAIQRMRQPVIAAIDGAAVGGGFGIAMGCDIRLASPQAYFKATFIEMGLIPDYGLCWSLPRFAGYDAALEMLLTGRTVSAEEAQTLGLVTRICPEPLADAVALAAGIAQRSRAAVARTKRHLQRGAAGDLASVLVAEVAEQHELLTSADFSTRLAAWRARVRNQTG